jgi:MSHA biogenesis protein MshO
MEIRRRVAGVTLIELVVTLVLSAIVAGLIGSFIARPFEGYGHARVRADLVDGAEGALVRMAREVRLALPNSVRVAAGGLVLELLHTVDGARYRASAGVNPSAQDHSAAADWLDFTSADAQWNVLGRFSNLAFSYGAPLSAGHRVALYPAGSAVWSDAASGANPGTITPAGTAITLADDGDEDQLALSSAFRFALASPRQRLYLVDGPITFRCDPTAGTLTRYAGYAPAASQPTDPAAAPLASASAALLAESVAACAFAYDAGTATRGGLVTLALTLARAGEQVRMAWQVHVDNAP